jgi:hypothetical protein
VGLNLQVANYVVHLDLPWNPARLDQRTSRAHRLGQTRGVHVTYLCSEEGIERGIEGTLAGKRAVRSAALDASSEVQELEAPSFSVFMRQLREVLDAMAAPGKDVEIAEEKPAAAELPAPEAQAALPAPDKVSPAALPAPGPGPEAVSGPPAASQEQARPPAGERRGPAQAANRLRLAHVVLDAGFHGEALRACYDALAAAIAGLVRDGAPQGHAAVVAAIYKELIPEGRLAPAAASALARLHDLTTLEGQGVDVPQALAAEAVAEAEQWVGRIAGCAATGTR